ncbi:PPC domain-containing protein [Aliikangiella maris]|uniref:PPC domain-containing protein n=2 Tax=Aliikangiella maris TaxID=3162458 RepID=A0ABV2BY69_9GAMM
MKTLIYFLFLATLGSVTFPVNIAAQSIQLNYLNPLFQFRYIADLSISEPLQLQSATKKAFDFRPFQFNPYQLNDASINYFSVESLNHATQIIERPNSAHCINHPTSCAITPIPVSQKIEQLQNGEKQQKLRLNRGESKVYSFYVPENANDVHIATQSGRGDVDLLVGFNQIPTVDKNDCHPQKNGNNESCRLDKFGGVYFIQLQAFEQFEDVELIAEYTQTVINYIKPIKVTQPNITLASNQWKRYSYDLQSGYANLAISISGKEGDIDLHVRHDSTGKVTDYACHPFKNDSNEHCVFRRPKAGKWFIDLYANNKVSNATIEILANP